MLQGPATYSPQPGPLGLPTLNPLIIAQKDFILHTCGVQVHILLKAGAKALNPKK